MAIFAYNSVHDFNFPKQKQRLQNDSNSLRNWFALRAMLEFDVSKLAYRYGTPGANHTLFNDGIAAFIDRIDNRFSELFQVTAAANEISQVCVLSKSSILVSELRRLFEAIAARSSASSAWLLRELINGCIAAEAQIKGDFQSYGELEQGFIENSPSLSNKDGQKELLCDQKVDLQGVMYSVHIDGMCCLHARPRQQEVQYVLHKVGDQGRIEIKAVSDMFPTPYMVVGRCLV